VISGGPTFYWIGFPISVGSSPSISRAIASAPSSVFAQKRRTLAILPVGPSKQRPNMVISRTLPSEPIPSRAGRGASGKSSAAAYSGGAVLNEVLARSSFRFHVKEWIAPIALLMFQRGGNSSSSGVE